jgi:large subunit ribosomal protein L29
LYAVARARPVKFGDKEAMKATVLREQTSEELGATLDQLHQELFDLRVRRDLGETEDPMRIRGLRRDMARVKTVLNEREGGK